MCFFVFFFSHTWFKEKIHLHIRLPSTAATSSFGAGESVCAQPMREDVTDCDRLPSNKRYCSMKHVLSIHLMHRLNGFCNVLSSWGWSLYLTHFLFWLILLQPLNDWRYAHVIRLDLISRDFKYWFFFLIAWGTFLGTVEKSRWLGLVGTCEPVKSTVNIPASPGEKPLVPWWGLAKRRQELAARQCKMLSTIPQGPGFPSLSSYPFGRRSYS